MVDYSNGKIYRIVCNNTGKVYIGSTTQPLTKRLSSHKVKYKLYLKDGDKKNIMRSFEILKENNYEIILIENVPCNNKEELLRRERYYIENTKCVNKQVPLRTDEEYRQDNKEKIRQHYKEYRKNNIEKLKEYQQKNRDRRIKYLIEYYQKNKNKFKEYNQQNSDRKKQSNKERYIRNIDAIKEKNRQNYVCSCGSSVRINGKSRHLKTKKHLKYLESLNNTN